MCSNMSHGNTEEAFVLSSLKEFVNIWGSGSRALLNLECQNGSAWVKLTVQLAHPADYHISHPVPQPDPPEVPVYHQRRRHKGPARREKDRQRAAAHRARIGQLPMPQNTRSGTPAERAGPPPSNAAEPAEPAGALSSPPACPSPSTSTMAVSACLPPPPFRAAEPAGTSSTSSRASVAAAAAGPTTSSTWTPPLYLRDAVCTDQDYNMQMLKAQLENNRKESLDTFRKEIEKLLN